MIQIHPISILAPLAVGVVAQACTIIIYLVPVRATVNLIGREKGLGHVGMPWTDLGIFARAVFYASLAHLVEITLWMVSVFCVRTPHLPHPSARFAPIRFPGKEKVSRL